MILRNCLFSTSTKLYLNSISLISFTNSENTVFYLYKLKIIIAMIVLILFFVTFLHLLGDGCGNSKSIRLIGDWLSFLANVVSCSCLTLYNSHSLIQLVSRSVSICLVLTSTTLNNYTNTIFNVSILFEHLSVYFLYYISTRTKPYFSHINTLVLLFGY